MHHAASTWPCLATVLLTCSRCLAAKAKVQSSACPTWLTRPYERAFLLQLVACGGNNRDITHIPLAQNAGMFPALLMWQCSRATPGTGGNRKCIWLHWILRVSLNRSVNSVPGPYKVPDIQLGAVTKTIPKRLTEMTFIPAIQFLTNVQSSPIIHWMNEWILMSLE